MSGIYHIIPILMLEMKTFTSPLELDLTSDLARVLGSVFVFVMFLLSHITWPESLFKHFA